MPDQPKPSLGIIWLNDDIDRTHAVDGSDFEEDDIGPVEAAKSSNNWKPDCEDDIINSERDLEDLSRIVVSLRGLVDAVKPPLNKPEADLFIGLKWTVTAGTPAIRLFNRLGDDGTFSYLTDPAKAAAMVFAPRVVDARHYDPNNPAATVAPEFSVIEGSQTSSQTFIIPSILFVNLSEANPTIPFLFEGVKPGKGQLQLVILKKDGTNYTEIGEGPGVWMDLKKIGDMYEHWSVGQGPDPRGGGEPDAVAARITSLTGSPTAFKYDNGSPSPEERKYILYVHGWNMERWEKERFAETAFKRLWWQGYKGRFGLFSWPTTNRFDPQPPFYKDAATDPTNYDRGEWAAWKSATPLRALLQTLHGPGAYGDQVYVLAHSMGNVVAGEALRLASQQGAGRLVNTYVASQAAIPVHVYDGSSTNLLDAIGPLGIAASTIDQFPQTPNTVYPDWLAGNGAAAGTRINFYNVNDFALWRDAWQLNQYMKPDHKDAPDQSWNYTFEDGLGAPPDLHSSFIRFDHYDDLANPVGIQEMQLGTQAAVGARYEIMAFNAESRSKALGGTADAAKLTDSVNLQSPTVWPVDTSGDSRPYSRHKWHSAEFRSTIMRQQGYWKTLLGPSGFNLGTTP
ncbi:MAG: alpha/beta hydrolase [Lacunisphaera sp.]